MFPVVAIVTMVSKVVTESFLLVFNYPHSVRNLKDKSRWFSLSKEEGKMKYLLVR